MSENPRDDLLAIVGKSGFARPPVLENPTAVEVGQIRKLRAYDDDLDSVLVLVLYIDQDSSHAKVVIVFSPCDDATVRDVVVDRDLLGLHFDIAIRGDAVATAWLTQLSQTPMVGRVSSEIVDLVRRGPRLTTPDLAQEAERSGLKTGVLMPQTGDPLWWRIGRAAEHLAKLTDACHEAMLSEPIADPAILPSLIYRANPQDRFAAVALKDALEAGQAVLSTDALEACRQPLARTAVRNPDVWRFLEKQFLENTLRRPRATSTAAAGPAANDIGLSKKRLLPEELTKDPLDDLVSASVQSGSNSSRVWTSRHLWATPDRVMHTEIEGHHHAIVAEFADAAEESS